MSSRLLKNIGLFCRIQSLLQGSFAKDSAVINLDTNQGRRDDTNQNRSRHRKFFFLSFAKEPYKRDYILQEIPMTLRYGSLQIKKDHGTVITIYVETDRYGSHSSRQKGKRFFLWVSIVTAKKRMGFFYRSLSSRQKRMGFFSGSLSSRQKRIRFNYGSLSSRQINNRLLLWVSFFTAKKIGFFYGSLSSGQTRIDFFDAFFSAQQNTHVSFMGPLFHSRKEYVSFVGLFRPCQVRQSVAQL